MVDLSGDWSTRQIGQTILNEVEPGAVVFGWWDTVPVIQYLQLVEGNARMSQPSIVSSSRPKILLWRSKRRCITVPYILTVFPFLREPV